MLTEHYYVSGPGLELGHMEVDEKMVIVVVKACSLWGRQT